MSDGADDLRDALAAHNARVSQAAGDLAGYGGELVERFFRRCVAGPFTREEALALTKVALGAWIASVDPAFDGEEEVDHAIDNLLDELAEDADPVWEAIREQLDDDP